jgi:hypothetical protein
MLPAASSRPGLMRANMMPSCVACVARHVAARHEIGPSGRYRPSYDTLIGRARRFSVH